LPPWYYERENRKGILIIRGHFGLKKCMLYVDLKDEITFDNDNEPHYTAVFTWAADEAIGQLQVVGTQQVGPI
jgi:hypothetical protein